MKESTKKEYITFGVFPFIFDDLLSFFTSILIYLMSSFAYLLLLFKLAIKGMKERREKMQVRKETY